ncbi:Alpha/beta hydrolase fold-1 [Microdochium trichocladiopsis]|uniref:Alpha/beta hydrolase fold-1 n=1 Tax=Microdochium trichocladiopsis TaxID=1682393 RepID=A0A9P8YAP2_9PEZI|nr:Alpha/beta hydrolase fold-1 [Microdochium trichocladiopsis]KAH7034792.1 Alpha/beta hydrolase fold-1 [Microdochium trichocladiopsis]
MAETPEPEKPVILLVHGAWHAPGYYKGLINPLRKAGYTVVAPALATAGADDSILGKTLFDDVKRCEEALAPYLPAEEGKDGREVVVVAHSYGGIPGTQFCAGNTVAERAARGLKGGVKSIVYLTGYVLAEAGTKLADYEPLMDFFDVNRFYAADVPDASTRDAMYSLLGDHSAVAFMTPVTLGAADLKDVPKTYILCTKDETIFPEVQRKMADAVGARVVEIEAGHSPFAVEGHVEVLVREIEAAAAAAPTA